MNTAAFLSKITPQAKNLILSAIAKRYGTQFSRHSSVSIA